MRAKQPDGPLVIGDHFRAEEQANPGAVLVWRAEEGPTHPECVLIGVDIEGKKLRMARVTYVTARRIAEMLLALCDDAERRAEGE